MFRLLVIAFIVVPIVEVWLLIQAGSAIGGWETFLLMILVSLVGAALVRREGLGLLARFQTRLETGQLPTRELVQGMLVVLAGALLLTPGFLTDGVGLLLLFSPTRAAVAALILVRMRRRATEAGRPVFRDDPMGPAGRSPRDGVIDIGEISYERPDDDPNAG